MYAKSSLARTLVPVVLIAVFAGESHAQSRQQQAMLRSANEASTLLEGTWVLQQRFTPSGKPHKQPLRGEFTLKLPVDAEAVSQVSADGEVTLARGSYIASERGVLDALYSEVAAEDASPALASAGTAARGGDMLFELNASSQLEMSMSARSPSTVTINFRNLEFKGTYGVFRQGVRASQWPMKFRKSDSGFSGSTLSLRDTSVAPSDLQMAPDARGPGSPGDKSHDIVAQVIRGNRMEITYGNGGRDIWIRKK